MALSHPDQGIVIDFAVSPDQHWLVRDGRDSTILLYDLLKHEWTAIGVPDQSETADGTVGCLRFALGGLGLVFVASSSEGQIHICPFDPEHDRYAIRRILPIFGVQGMKISPDGKLLAITNVGADSIRGVYVYNLEHLQLLQEFPTPIGTYYDLLAFHLITDFWQAVEMRAFSISGHVQRLSASLPLKLIQVQDLMRDIGQQRLAGLIGQQQVTLQLEERVSRERIC